MEARLGRAERDAEGLGYRRHRQPDVVVEDEHGPLVHREAAEATLEQIAVGDLHGLVPDAPWGHRGELDLDGPATTSTNGVVAGVNGQSVEPGVEPVGITQTS
jgi:hypothetical protein